MKIKRVTITIKLEDGNEEEIVVNEPREAAVSIDRKPPNWLPFDPELLSHSPGAVVTLRLALGDADRVLEQPPGIPAEVLRRAYRQEWRP